MKISKEGFCQEPQSKVINNVTYQLEQELIHIATGNVFTIKEIQDRGFICYLAKTLGTYTNNTSKVYLSNADLNQYR